MRGTHVIMMLPALLLGTGCADGDLEASEVDCAEVTPAADVTIDGDGFSPADVAVDVGAVVRWVNEGDTVQSVVSGNPGDDDAGGLFQSGDLEVGDEYCVRFEIVGSYPYHSGYDDTREGAVEAEGPE